MPVLIVNLTRARKRDFCYNQAMLHQRITSAANPHIKDMVKARSRPSAGAFFIEGPHLVGAAIHSAAAIREVFFSPSFASSDEGAELMPQLSRKAGRVFEVTDAVMKKLSDTEAPQGVLALTSLPTARLADLSPGANPLITVIEGVQDPGNVGTIIRLADAAAGDIVIVLHGSCDPYMPKAVRATAGSIFNIPVIRARTDECLDWLRLRKITLAVTSAKGNQSIFAASLAGPVAFAFGNEAKGISKTLGDAADMTINIPIYGRAESINVATAAAVCLYEAARQRQGPAYSA